MVKLLFLETTIQADRNFNYKSERNKVNAELEGKTLLCSTYVLGEFVNNFLQNTITFYNLLIDSTSTGEALVRLGSRFHSTRQYNRVMRILSVLTEDGKINREELLPRLDILIEDIMISRFYSKLQLPLIDGTKCHRAIVKPVKEDGLWRLRITCRKNPKPPCRMEQFYTEHKENFVRLEEITDDHLKECIGIVKNINNKKDLPLGKNCWAIGDFVICHESPNNSVIYTTNLKDYEPICNIIGKKLYKPN